MTEKKQNKRILFIKSLRDKGYTDTEIMDEYLKEINKGTRLYPFLF